MNLAAGLIEAGGEVHGPSGIRAMLAGLSPSAVQRVRTGCLHALATEGVDRFRVSALVGTGRG